MKILLSLTFILASFIQTVAFGSNFSCAAKCDFDAESDITGYQIGGNYGGGVTRIYSVASTMEEAAQTLESKCKKMAHDYSFANKGKSFVVNQGSKDYEAIVTC